MSASVHAIMFVFVYVCVSICVCVCVNNYLCDYLLGRRRYVCIWLALCLSCSHQLEGCGIIQHLCYSALSINITQNEIIAAQVEEEMRRKQESQRGCTLIRQRGI